jgi:hypothetical protein
MMKNEKLTKDRFLITALDELSTRSLNIVKHLGGEAAMMEYYLNHKSFVHINKCGYTSNKELSIYCDYLIVKHNENIQESLNITNFPEINNSIETASILYTLYKAQKLKLSQRAINALDSLESMYELAENLDIFYPYLKKYIILMFEYKNLRNIGRKTAIELEQFAFDLRDLIHKKQLLPTQTNQTKIASSNNLQLINNLDYDITSLKIDGKYAVELLFAVFIFYAKELEKWHQLITQYYFGDKLKSIKELSKMLDYSDFHLSNIIKKIESNQFPSVIQDIRNKFDDSELELNINSDGPFFNFYGIEPFSFNKIDFKPNIRYAQIFYKLYFKGEFIPIHEVFDIACFHIKSFDIENKHLFISKSWLNEVSLNNLLLFLNDSIYEFERISFEYDLEVLISRFYKENDLALEKHQIKYLLELINQIKSTEIKIDYKKIKRLESDELNNAIVTECESILTEKGIAIKSKPLLEKLHYLNYDIEKNQLLKILNQHSSTFIRIGADSWALKAWDQSKIFNGSLKDIVTSLLSKQKEPMHVSELLVQIAKFRPLSEHSLLTNLRIQNNNKFIFFNCYFIGLTGVKYEDYWHQLPQVDKQHFSEWHIKELKQITKGRVIPYMVRHYRYPLIHVKYLFEQKKARKNGIPLKLDF